jgi:hypothetical protein
MHGFAFRNRTAVSFPVLTTADQTLYRTMGLAGPGLHRSALPTFLRYCGWSGNGRNRSSEPATSHNSAGAFVVAAGGDSVPWAFRAHRACGIARADAIVDALTAAAKSVLEGVADGQ